MNTDHTPDLAAALRLAVGACRDFYSPYRVRDHRWDEARLTEAADLIEANLPAMAQAGEFLAALRPFARAAPKVLGFGDTSSAQVIAHMPRVDWERAAALVEALDAGETAGEG